ncbi:MAG: OmpH family outer membrane protein [Rhodospirillaceae bacterium]|nr:OmpH family outer membrane protein [Rhodospirillaceae bacterium]
MTNPSGVRLLAGCLFTASALLLSQPSWGQGAATPPAPSIAVVDVDGVLQQSTAAKSARTQIERYQQSYRDEVEKKESGLRAKQMELQKQSQTLSQEQMIERARAFDADVAAFRREAEMKGRALDKSYGAAMEKINKALIETVGEVAQAHGANVVLPRTQVMLYDEKMNVTKEVIEGLNKRLADVTVPAPQVEAAPAAAAPKKKAK